MRAHIATYSMERLCEQYWLVSHNLSKLWKLVSQNLSKLIGEPNIVHIIFLNYQS
jgi:hypothetical protein